MANAVSYAEDELGVHETYNNWVTVQKILAEQQMELVLAQAAVRRLELAINEKRDEILVNIYDDEVNRHKDNNPSAALVERAIRLAYARNEALKTLNRQLTEEQIKLQNASHASSVSKHTMTGLAARLNELAGLLYFYGIAKQERDKT